MGGGSDRARDWTPVSYYHPGQLLGGHLHPSQQSVTDHQQLLSSESGGGRLDLGYGVNEFIYSIHNHGPLDTGTSSLRSMVDT